VSEYFKRQKVNSKGTVTNNRQALFDNTGGTSSNEPISVPPGVTYNLFKKGSQPRDNYISNSGCPNGAELVGKKSRSFQWENPNITTSRLSNPNGCLQDGLGSSLSWSTDGGIMVFSGEASTYKCAGAIGSKICSDDLYQIQKGTVCTSTNRQYHSFDIPFKNGGDTQSSINKNIKRNLGIFTNTSDHDYCRIPSQSTEYNSRLGVTSCEQFQRVDAPPNSFQNNLQTFWDTGYRPFCFPNISSSSSIHVMEARSSCSGNRCLPTQLGKSVPLCIPTIFPNRKGFEKSRERKSKSTVNNSSLAITTLVSNSFRNVSKITTSITQTRESISKHPGIFSSSSNEQFNEVGSVVCFRENFSSEGISQKASELITNARRSGTISNYKSSWRKWAGWCEQKQINPFRAPLNEILNFLAGLFDKGLAYNTINSHRSAISAYHSPIEGFAVGKHPKVTALMTGTFNLRPPQPKYCFIWNVDQVLSKLRTWFPHDILSDKNLTLKTTMLLGLSAASRCSELCILNIRCMTVSDVSYIFTFNKTFKSWKKGQPAPAITFSKFVHDESLCVYTALKDYLKRSEKWRLQGTSQLLLSYINPHEPVVTSTISRWMVSVLNESGIDTSTFKAHSVRSASSTKAKVQGLSIKDILKRGHWKRESTFTRFYNKSVLEDISSERYQATVLV